MKQALKGATALLEKNKEVNELIDRILDMNISIEVTNLLNKMKERVNE